MRSHRYLISSLASLALIAGAVSVGCSTKTPAFEGIANQGIVTVSPQSSFVGANVFLAQEMEGSSYLYNFMRSRGSPQAIELSGTSEMGAQINLFYSREREFYTAVPKLHQQTKTKEWIIRGPYPITREQYPYVSKLNADQGGVFEIFGRTETFGGAGKTIESRVIAPAFIPTPRPKPIRQVTKSKSKKDESEKLEAKPTSVPALGPIIAVQGTPINLDQKALMEARSAATPSQAVATAAAPEQQIPASPQVKPADTPKVATSPISPTPPGKK
jgi:hypothetical protein